jgi:hypothetical protein
VVFFRLGHPLREKLRDLETMNMIRGIQGYSNVLSMTPSESFTRHELSALLGTPLVDVHMEIALAGVQDTMYPLVALSCDVGIC